jgi:hypothetical protein
MYKSRKAVGLEPLARRESRLAQMVACRLTAHARQRSQAEDRETKTAIQMHRLIHVDNVW